MPAAASSQVIQPGAWDVTSKVVDLTVPGMPGFIARMVRGKSRAEHKRVIAGQGVEALLAPDPKARCRVDGERIANGRYEQALTCPQKTGDPLHIPRAGTYTPAASLAAQPSPARRRRERCASRWSSTPPVSATDRPEGSADRLVGPGKAARRARSWLEVDHEWQNAEIAMLSVTEPHLRYLGEWHSHPAVRDPVPSRRDRKVLAELAAFAPSIAQTPS